MALFFHDVVLKGDVPGLGVWLNEHYQEHLLFARTGLAQATPVFVPDYNIALWSDIKHIRTQWLDAHQKIHDVLRTWTGVSGVDLSNVDLDKEEQWYIWMDTHAAEHKAIRGALGLN